MKKIILLLLILLMCINCVFCSTLGEERADLKIICTVFPQFDWCRQLLKGTDEVDLQLIMKNGSDFHNYQPSAADIIEIKNSDMIIYIGGESDLWLSEILSDGYDGIGINLINELDIHCDMHDHDHGVDEHIWLSVKNAIDCCNVITQKLCEIDPTNTEIYELNLELYTTELLSLDNEYKHLIDSENKSIVVADRNPFAHLAHDYGIECFSAYEGCYAESEVNFDTIIRLAGKIDELKLKNIVITETSDGKIADSVIKASKSAQAGVLVFNSIQSVNEEFIHKNSYVDVMKANLDVLKEAFITLN